MNQISAKETENVMKIDVSHITMIYPSGKKALQDISLSAESPNFIGVLGPNGAGKTTLMKLLIAELLPTKGEISLDGKPLLSQERYLKSQLGYLPQKLPDCQLIVQSEVLRQIAKL